MFLNQKMKRYLPLFISLFTVAMYWGIINSFFGVNASTNIAQTGVTLGFITGCLNLFLWWMLYKRRIA